jgi:DNA-binding GntR family transcriptional regulator
MRGGRLLSELEVAAQLGVSRTPVHEAFLRLAAEDLLDPLPRRGAVVVPVPPREATDLLEMRIAIEASAVRRPLPTTASYAFRMRVLQSEAPKTQVSAAG